MGGAAPPLSGAALNRAAAHAAKIVTRAPEVTIAFKREGRLEECMQPCPESALSPLWLIRYASCELLHSYTRKLCYFIS
jgi:hypothetical protein